MTHHRSPTPTRPAQFAAVFLILLIVLAGCDDLSGPGGGEMRSVITRFETEPDGSGSASASAFAAAPRTYGEIAADIEDETCGVGRIICLTPETLAGRIYTGGMMVGGTSRDVPGFALTTIAPNDGERVRPDQGRGGELTFDVAATTDLTGSYSCCGGPIPYPQGDAAAITRLELNFDYLDVTFTVPAEAGTALAGETFVIRQVYVDTATADDVDDIMIVGDKLIRSADETRFRWCDSMDCDNYTRPAADDLLRADRIQLEPDLPGNPHYATFAIPLEGAASVPFSQEEAEAGGWLFHVAFDLTDGAIFEMNDFTEMDDEWSLVRAFHLLGGVGYGNSSVGVRLSKEASPDGGQNIGGGEGGGQGG